jgi:hypothetical protein
MPIVGMLANTSFDPETTRVLIAAFDAAWRQLEASPSLCGQEVGAARDLLAKCVIEQGRGGQLDQDQLMKKALARFAQLNSEVAVRLDAAAQLATLHPQGNDRYW